MTHHEILHPLLLEDQVENGQPDHGQETASSKTTNPAGLLQKHRANSSLLSKFNAPEEILEYFASLSQPRQPNLLDILNGDLSGVVLAVTGLLDGVLDLFPPVLSPAVPRVAEPTIVRQYSPEAVLSALSAIGYAGDTGLGLATTTGCIATATIPVAGCLTVTVTRIATVTAGPVAIMVQGLTALEGHPQRVASRRYNRGLGQPSTRPEPGAQLDDTRAHYSGNYTTSSADGYGDASAAVVGAAAGSSVQLPSASPVGILSSLSLPSIQVPSVAVPMMPSFSLPTLHTGFDVAIDFHFQVYHSRAWVFQLFHHCECVSSNSFASQPFGPKRVYPDPSAVSERVSSEHFAAQSVTAQPGLSNSFAAELVPPECGIAHFACDSPPRSHHPWHPAPRTLHLSSTWIDTFRRRHLRRSSCCRPHRRRTYYTHRDPPTSCDSLADTCADANADAVIHDKKLFRPVTPAMARGNEFVDGLRPFGTSVVDELDFAKLDNSSNFWATFAARMRANFLGDMSKEYYLSAVLGCTSPDRSIPIGYLAQCNFIWPRSFGDETGRCKIGGDNFLTSPLQWWVLSFPK
ncbi:hypothetical protein QBC36DRAFT_311881 [Triangularia setosa]|uniref:Uncharacterized protein n=1 Tax=Triangularia setosa TaxID=2587417 RepID=A0AAN6W567_9PEZI|nr:hypothetical protein QBC36DRAFT_311881 [Podospora setosa]